MRVRWKSLALVISLVRWLFFEFRRFRPNCLEPRGSANICTPTSHGHVVCIAILALYIQVWIVLLVQRLRWNNGIVVRGTCPVPVYEGLLWLAFSLSHAQQPFKQYMIQHPAPTVPPPMVWSFPAPAPTSSPQWYGRQNAIHSSIPASRAILSHTFVKVSLRSNFAAYIRQSEPVWY